MQPRITLATLAQATRQQVFDQSVSGVIAQGRKSAKPKLPGEGMDGCFYLSSDGAMCAAGQLMTPLEARTCDEADANTDWRSIVAEGIAPDAHFELIKKLQVTHDVIDAGPEFVEQFKLAAQALAEREDLDPAVAL